MVLKKYGYHPSFRVFWIITTLIFFIQILFFKIPKHFLSVPFNNLLLAICSYFLIKHYTSPLPKVCTRGNQTKILLVSLITLILLSYSKSVIGKYLYIIIPIVTISFTLYFKNFIHKRHVMFAVFLTILSILSAFARVNGQFSSIDWALLQVFLVFPGFLGGLAILSASGIGYLGIGRSIFVTEGLGNSLKSFFYGIFLSLPWAFGKILMGSVEEITWVTDWRNLLASFYLGVGAEGWSRVFFVPLFFYVFSKFSNTGKVFRASTLIVAYWSSYLYLSATPYNIFIVSPISVILFAMPIATIMFNKNIETALGFHFSIQFFRLLAAYLINNNILS